MFNYGIIKCHSRQPSAHLAAPTEQVSFQTKAACFTVGCMAARIAGNFGGRKLSRIGEKYDFRGKNFCRLLTFAAPKDTMPPNFAENTFANSHKTARFAKVFSLESFPPYGTSFT